MTNTPLFNYIIHLADNNLILGQRLSEWCGHGPALEEDIALANTALDYLGQATHLFKYAAEIEGKGHDEDHLAFLRDAWNYKNALITEMPNGDYAFTTVRQFLYSAWYGFTLQQLAQTNHDFLKGFAEKSIKEVRYHVQHSSDWVKRLGDGTEESHQRMQKAIDEIWTFTGELFSPVDYELELGFVNQEKVKEQWLQLVKDVFSEATLQVPADQWMQKGGKTGKHTEYLGYMLAEMQYLPRAYPGAKW